MGDLCLSMWCSLFCFDMEDTVAGLVAQSMVDSTWSRAASGVFGGRYR